MLSITPVDLLEKLFPARRKVAVDERVKAGIKAKTIYTRELGPFKEDINKEQLREGMYLTKANLPIDMTITIFPWGIKLFHLHEHKPFGVLIENKEIARNMRAVFNLAWEGAKNLSKNSETN